MELLIFCICIGLTGIVTYLFHVHADIEELDDRNTFQNSRLSRLEDEMNHLFLSSSSQLIPVKNELKREIKLVADEVMLLKQKNEVKKINKKRKKK